MSDKIGQPDPPDGFNPLHGVLLEAKSEFPDVRTLAAIHAPPYPRMKAVESALMLQSEDDVQVQLIERASWAAAEWAVNYADALLAKLAGTEETP